jgi:hypothetical protein
LLVGVRRSLANHLVQSHPTQAAHDSGTDHESEKERGHCRACRAEGYPLEQSQKSKVRQSYEWNE